MKVKELKDRGKVEEITLKVTSKEEAREVRGGSLRVCNMMGEDDTGKVVVTLWNDEIEKVKEGDTIKISNGWSQIYQEAMQISAGRFGKLEVVDESGGKE